jgi:hypothetical protein
VGELADVWIPSEAAVFGVQVQWSEGRVDEEEALDVRGPKQVYGVAWE